MKRIHIGLQVTDIPGSIRFYSALFGAPPCVERPDYAKWMLDDPRVNFSINARCGIGREKVHFGIQVEESGEFEAVSQRLAGAGLAARETRGESCCYAHSDKTWSADPDGFPWETFLTHGLATSYGSETLSEQDVAALTSSSRGCCGGAPESGEAKGGETAGPGCC